MEAALSAAVLFDAEMRQSCFFRMTRMRAMLRPLRDKRALSFLSCLAFFFDWETALSSDFWRLTKRVPSNCRRPPKVYLSLNSLQVRYPSCPA